MIFGINTARDISKLSQIYEQQFGNYITSNIYAKYHYKSCYLYKSEKGIRGTQRQFSENICSEDDLRSRIFGTFVVEFLACLLPQDFRTSEKWYNCPFLPDFYPKKVT